MSADMWVQCYMLEEVKIMGGLRELYGQSSSVSALTKSRTRPVCAPCSKVWKPPIAVECYVNFVWDWSLDDDSCVPAYFDNV